MGTVYQWEIHVAPEANNGSDDVRDSLRRLQSKDLLSLSEGSALPLTAYCLLPSRLSLRQLPAQLAGEVEDGAHFFHAGGGAQDYEE